MNILLVEDNAADADLIQEMFSPDGADPIRIWWVARLSEALNRLREDNIDLALLDLGLPDSEGIDSVRSLVKAVPYLPIVVLTGLDDEKMGIGAVHEGAQDYLFKNEINPDSLRRAIKYAVQRKKTEQELKESEQRYRAVIEHSNDGVAILDGTLHVFVNRKYLDIFGYQQPESLLNQSISKILHPDDRQPVMDIIADGIRGIEVPSRYECRGLKKDGRTVYIEASAALSTFQGNRVILVYLRDITQRRKAEKDHILLATAIEQASEIVVITDRNGDIVYVNPAMEEISGYRKEELIGHNPRMVQSGEHDHTFYSSMWDTLIAGEMWKGRFINRKKDGSHYMEDASITPIKNARGEIINFVAVKRDVTDEIKKERQLRQAQKMEAIGTLAGGIAHDFNNILSAIIGYSELSLIKCSKNNPLCDYLEEIYRAGIRAKDLVKQILTFSRQAEDELKPVQVKLIVKEALKLLRATLPTTIEIRKKITSDRAVLADPTQIHQILMNLCTNAGHAMREKGGRLEVALKDEAVDAEFASRCGDIVPGPYLKLSVEDTGHGIETELMDKIFDPFFTTKKREEGTGMGLAVVHGIVKSLNGAIMVYSERGKGTTFNVYLPIVGLDNDTEMKISEPVFHGSGKILFVDDEEVLAHLGKEMLEHQGYLVTTSTSSIEALNRIKSNPAEFDLLITDLTMPNMTGVHLAREAMRIRPDLPVIICSGFSKDISAETAKAVGIKAYIHKPIISTNLVAAVGKVLNSD